jgi:hypothetical protein
VLVRVLVLGSGRRLLQPRDQGANGVLTGITDGAECGNGD